MISSSIIFEKKVQYVFHELFETVYSYLDFSSLMESLMISTDFFNLVSQYLRNFLISKHLIDASAKELSGNYYLKQFRYYYSRELLLGDLDLEKDSLHGLRPTRYSRCSTYGLKDFILGSKFVIFQMFNNDILYMKCE